MTGRANDPVLRQAIADEKIRAQKTLDDMLSKTHHYMW